MRKGQGWERRGGFLLLAPFLGVLVGAGEAAGRPAAGPPAPPPQERQVDVGSCPCARAVQPLLAQLWAAGFFRHNEAVRREILNNEYSFFTAASPQPPPGSKGRGCYCRNPGGTDVILLRKDLFASFEVSLDGVTLFPGWSRRALPVLVHEITHDLWSNILDAAERGSFCLEGAKLMEDYRMALTPEDRRLFLDRAGDDSADPRALRSYAGIEEILGLRPVGSIRGHELFAWLAERLFTLKAPIPKPLQKYYAGILSDVPAAPARPLR